MMAEGLEKNGRRDNRYCYDRIMAKVACKKNY
jgi:hypothetical protein